MPLTVFARQQRESIKKELTDKIGELMTGVAGHPILLYEVVAAGSYNFRLAFGRTFRGYPIDDHLADLVFKFFCDQVVRRHPHADTAKGAATAMLDHMEVPSPLTADEIERAWVHEVFSSEDGRRANYRDGAGMAGQDHKVIIKS